VSWRRRESGSAAGAAENLGGTNSLSGAITLSAATTIAAAAGTRPRDLAASAIQRELLRQGAYLSPAIEAAMQPASAAE